MHGVNCAVFDIMWVSALNLFWTFSARKQLGGIATSTEHCQIVNKILLTAMHFHCPLCSVAHFVPMFTPLHAALQRKFQFSFLLDDKCTEDKSC